LLNEKNEALRLLEGKTHEKEGWYRACIILIKYYKYLGQSKLEIRQNLYDWKNKFNIENFDFEINQVIKKVFDENLELIDKVNIQISKNEIDEIFKRFDNEMVRYIAFLVLCTAKFRGNKHKVFDMSLYGLSCWGDISYSNLKQKIIPELIDFEFIQVVDKNNVGKKLVDFNKGKQKTFSKGNTYKMLIDYGDDEFYLVEDDLNMMLEFENIKKITNYDIIDRQHF